MPRPARITRRRAIAAGLAAAGGVVAWRAPGVLPPTHGHPLRMGDTLTYAAHRALLSDEALVPEYTRADLTSFPAVGTSDPGTLEGAEAAQYRAAAAAGFGDWRLQVSGLAAKPAPLSLADLRALPSRTQITRHTCEEGWTAIGEWTGVPLRHLLDAVQASPDARFVVFESFDGWVDCIDMADALHPQTLLAYGMNGRDLPLAHGAPVRLRVERQAGYKSMKYVRRMAVSDRFDDGGPRGHIGGGWAWYAGI